MSCERARRLWWEWDWSEREGLPPEIEVHLRECAACAQVLARERAVSQALRALARAPAPAVDVARRVAWALPAMPRRRSPWPWAALAGLAAAVSLAASAALGFAARTWWVHGEALQRAGWTALDSLAGTGVVLARAALAVTAAALQLLSRVQPWFASAALAGLAAGMLWAVVVVGRELVGARTGARG